MAKIVEDVVLLKFSRLVKDEAADSRLIDEEVCASIEQVAQEIVGDSIIVEIVRAVE